MSHDLQQLRQQIDQLDQQILGLLNQRATIAQEVGALKAVTDAPVFRPEREAQVLRQLNAQNQGPLPAESVSIIFREVMSACRALEKKLTVAYLGPAGTFSEQAMRLQFGQSVQGQVCISIDDVFKQVEAGSADFGIVPVENSSEGTVNRTLDLFLQTPLLISAEIAIPVHHNLMQQTGQMDGVKRICAHSQALAQCQLWLNQHYPHIERHAVASNAEGAVLASQDPTIAAIGGEQAADQYGLSLVARHIQDDPHNRTRFAVIGQLETAPSGLDQTSLILSVSNKPGAVYRLLAPLAEHGVSMTRFESRPARMGAWEYYFYVDLEGHAKDAAVTRALHDLKEQAAFFKMLGSYPIT